MNGQQILIQHAQPLQMLYRALTPAGVGIFLFLLGLGHMHVDADAVFIRQFLGADAQLIGVVENGAQAKPNLYPSVGGIVEFLQIHHLLLQFLLHGALPDFRQSLAAVHHRFGQLTAQTGFRRTAGHAGDELSARFCKGGYAGANQLKTGHQRGYIRVLLRHVALKGPHPVMKPADEIHIIAYAPGNLLGGVHMGIHKPGQHIPALQVNDLRVGLHQPGVNLTDRRNAVILHQHAAAVKNGVLLIHGDDVAVLQIGLHEIPPSRYLSSCFVNDILILQPITVIGSSPNFDFSGFSSVFTKSCRYIPEKWEVFYERIFDHRGACQHIQHGCPTAAPL